VDSSIIRKYDKRRTANLKLEAIRVFHKFIRQRDMDDACISCGRYVMLEAGHFWSAGKFNQLRFNEYNVHGQCKQCNYHLSGNLLKYRVNLIKKVGLDIVEGLDFIALRRSAFKDDRLLFIEIIEKYK